MCAPPDEYRDPGTPRAAKEREERIRASDGVDIRMFLAEPAHGLEKGADGTSNGPRRKGLG